MMRPDEYDDAVAARDEVYRDEHGDYHRVDGPAISQADGYQAWYIHGLRHRDDGPAVSDPAWGSREWWRGGELHRDDGPAIVHDDGYTEWWINGTQIIPPTRSAS